MSIFLDSREFKLILKPKIFQDLNEGIKKVQKIIEKEVEMLNGKFKPDSDLTQKFRRTYYLDTLEQNLIVFLRQIETEYKAIHLSNLVLKLLKFFYLQYNSRYNNRDIIDSYTLLANNHNFLTHLNKIKQDFDSQYNLFKSMTNTLR